MNIHHTLNCLFPDGFVIDCGESQGGSLEVHGLPTGAIPQNCEVLASGRSRFFWGHSHQDVYLVRTADFLVLLRIGAAGPEAGDGAFAVSRSYAPVESVVSIEFLLNARKHIDVLCTAVPA